MRELGTGRIAIVTGVARGIGRQIAGSFADAGYRVVINDIDQERLEGVRATFAADGADVMSFVADVRDEADVRRMMDATDERFGQIDVLVNNAAVVAHGHWGPAFRWPPVRDMEFAFWQRVIDTNLDGVFLCTKYALEHMRPRRTGHILNIWGGYRREPLHNPESIGRCAYVVTKHAVRAFTRFTAEEEREAGICIVLVEPAERAVASDEAPLDVQRAYPGPESVGNRFVLAAETGIELTGRLLRLHNGAMVAVD
jgi:NAD(P)-dependent dehydrogenase (short-subunit alcohol dehydrogenase family)